MQLYKHQEDVIRDNPSRVLLAHATGTGKTLTGITLANKNALTLLVVCPKMLKEKWQRDINEHGRERMITMILTKEEFKAKVKTIPRFDCVIIDEAHYFAGIKSQLHKAMVWYMKQHNITYRYLLTATPYLSTPLNIFALARILGHEWNYRTFIKEYFYEIPMGHRVIMKPRPNIEGKVADLVAKIGHIVDFETAITASNQSLPEQTHEVVRFDLTEEQIIAKRDHAYTQSTHIQQWTREHQIENGFVYREISHAPIHFHSNKNIWLANMATKYKKFIVFCRYHAQIELLTELFQSMDRNVLVIHGDVTNRDAIINEAERLDDCIIIIQSSCSAGYELPSFRIVIFASLDFSYVNYQQALGRNLRINKLAPNTYYYLVAEGVDTDVYDCIMKKQDFSFEIYNKKKL